MAESQKTILEQRAAVILAVILAISLAYSKLQGTVRTIPAQFEGTADLDIKAMMSALENASVEAGIKYSGEPLRDPMKKPAEVIIAEMPKTPPAERPLPANNTSGIKFQCQGIVYNGVRNIAIISGNVVAEGDRIGNAIVEKIEKNKVTLSMNGSKIELER